METNIKKQNWWLDEDLVIKKRRQLAVLKAVSDSSSYKRLVCMPTFALLVAGSYIPSFIHLRSGNLWSFAGYMVIICRNLVRSYS